MTQRTIMPVHVDDADIMPGDRNLEMWTCPSCGEEGVVWNSLSLCAYCEICGEDVTCEINDFRDTWGFLSADEQEFRRRIHPQA